MKNIVISICIIFLISGVVNIKLFGQSKIDDSDRIAGVDSIFAYQARIKSDRLFADLNSQRLADSLLDYGHDFLLITEFLFVNLLVKKDEIKKYHTEIHKKEEETKSKDSLQAAMTLEEEHNIKIMKEKFSEDTLTVSLITSLLQYFLDHCNETFEQSTRLDPFNLNNYQLSARSNWDRGIIFNDTLAHRQAVQLLSKFLNHDKGYASIYLDLGKNYYQLKHWQHAYQHIHRAFKVLQLTSYLEEKKPPFTGKYKEMKWLGNIEPMSYYDYMNEKAKAEIKVYLADSALASLAKAYALAPTKADSLTIERTTRWIKWDNGNLRALELLTAIDDSLNHENYSWARDAYLRLIPQLNTKAAKDDVHWRIARLDYSFLNEQEKAVNRLYQVVVSADTNKSTPYFYEPPKDSMYQVYFVDCGQMFYDLGIDYQKKGLFNKARSFFASDTSIDWPGRAKSFIYLAQLSLALDLSPEERNQLTFEQIKERATRNRLLAVRLLNRALKFKSVLKRQEIDFAYNQLIDLWKQINPQKVPAIFQEYQRYISTIGHKPSD